VLAPPVAAQVTTATLVGRVTDESGGALPGFAAEAKNLSSGFFFRAVTKEDGSFQLANLPPGTYELTVSGSGWQPQTKKVELLLG